jgi:hypothetical protein
MPRKVSQEDSYLSIKVDSYDAAAGLSVNLDLRTSVPYDYDDDDPVFTRNVRIELVGTSTYPDARAGDKYEITVYGELSERKQPRLKDAQVRDRHGVPAYRPCRGRQIPVFKLPRGLAVIEKRRGLREWTLCLSVLPNVTSDMLAMLSASRQLYAAVHERKVERQRWVLSFLLQTKDPAEEWL